MPATIRVSFSQMRDIENKLRNIPKGLEKVLKRASKRASSFGKTLIAKSISKDSNIKSRIVKEKISTGNRGKRGAFVRMKKTGRLGIRNFKATQTNEGVKYRIEKRGKWLFVPKAFQGPTFEITQIGEMVKQGRKKVFQRLAEPRKAYVTYQNPKWQGNAAVRLGKKRLPIVFVKGVSPAGYFAARKMLKPTTKQIETFFKKRIQTEVDFLLKQKSGGA